MHVSPLAVFSGRHYGGLPFLCQDEKYSTHASRSIFPPLSPFEYLKSGNANLLNGVIRPAKPEIGVHRLRTLDLEILLKLAFTGMGKKSLAYAIAIINMILRGGRRVASLRATLTGLKRI